MHVDDYDVFDNLIKCKGWRLYSFRTQLLYDLYDDI
jgi:hypothetical protein